MTFDALSKRHEPDSSVWIHSTYLVSTTLATGYMNEAELNLLHVADEACDEWFTKVKVAKVQVFKESYKNVTKSPSCFFILNDLVR